MGLFDFLKGGAKKTETAAQSTAAAGAAAAGAAGAAAEESAISSLLGEGGAKLTGLMDKLNVGGLDDMVKSWIGKGENKAVSPDQIKAALGSEEVAGVAAKLGVSEDEAANKIAKMLPGIIDKLTPDGLVPDPDSVADKLTGLFKK
ncbi:MAG: DUF937 domain-containing protein [Thermoleophilia bacterium]|nr:DUF937 domain-containing protein [Thermoleophilia bacterium]